MDIPIDSVVGRAWQDHIDQVTVNEDNTQQRVNNKATLKLAREAVMQRAKNSLTLIWPPRFLTDNMTGAELATKFGFGGDPAVLEGEWAYLTSIGSGAQGEAGLWVSRKLDNDGNLINRVVVKDCQFDSSWRRKPRHWIKNSFTDNKKELREPAMNRLIYEKYFLSRLYLDHCPFGDLHALQFKHVKYDPTGHNEMLDKDGQPLEPIPIPRRAIWSFFEDLAEAACIMAYGNIPLYPASKERDGWETLIHRDLKPHNIFLGLPRTTGERGIPELKVGDFGLAVPHNYEAIRNPHRMVSEGTVGWRAPEHSVNALRHTPLHLLSSATDLWAIGRIMLALVELLHSKPLDVFYGKPHESRVRHTPGKE